MCSIHTGSTIRAAIESFPVRRQVSLRVQALQSLLRRLACRLDRERLPVVFGCRSVVAEPFVRQAAVQERKREFPIELHGSRVVRDRQVVPLGVEVQVAAIVRSERVARIERHRRSVVAERQILLAALGVDVRPIEVGRGKDCRFAENADGTLERFGADCGRLPQATRGK